MWCCLFFLQGGKAERDKIFKTAGRFYMAGAGGICLCCYGLLFYCNGFFGIRKCEEPCYVPLYHSFCHTYILFDLCMVERLASLFEKQHEEEMRYQEIYYRELEKRNDDMQVLKHDLKLTDRDIPFF